MFLAIPLALACDCDISNEEKMSQSTLVFSGRAEATQVVNNEQLTSFRIYTLWKGGDIKRATITSDPLCPEIIKGEEYLVFAQETDGKMRADACTVTLSDADDLEGGVVLETSPRKTNKTPLYILLAAVVLGLTLFLHKRSRT